MLERGIGFTKVIETIFFHEIFDFFESSMKTSEILHHGLGCGKIGVDFRDLDADISFVSKCSKTLLIIGNSFTIVCELPHTLSIYNQ